jgi:hypothetical protein
VFVPADYLIVGLVVGLRILVPLLIPWFPLQAVLAALVLDAIDQTLFQWLTPFDLAAYQGYDKALDVYYLSMAYISTLRNWTNLFAFDVGRFLFYYRLLGVLLFEINGWRPLLLIFPNTFEYFFIWYEGVRLLWDPRRLSNRAVLAAAALIWIVIKLPQETWIHIARLDVTDLLKTRVFGADLATPWGEALLGAPLTAAGLLVAVAGLLLLLVAWMQRALPPPEHPPAWRGADYRETISPDQLRRARELWARRVFDRDLVEKTLLVAFLCVIFAQILPGSRGYGWEVAAVVALVTAANTIVSHSLARLGIGWRSVYRELLTMSLVNFLLAVAIILIGGGLGSPLYWSYTLLFALLLTLIVTLFDRFQEVHLARFPRVPL